MSTSNTSGRKSGYKSKTTRGRARVVTAPRPGFSAECRRQALRVRAHGALERRVMRELESVADLSGWT